MSEAPRIGAEIAGYRLESVLNRGGMAVVYVAEHIRLRRPVALKILAVDLAEDDRFRSRFLHESRSAAAINHPNIIPIYDAGEADGLLYISMLYVQGPDLKGLLRASRAMDVRRAISIISATGSAIDAAHQHGLIHRDVKPGNILIVERPAADAADHVYLSDFGLTKSRSRTGLTVTGQFVGTINYASPEQIQGGQLDGRADIYSLGCVLFECLTGAPPFDKPDEVSTLWAHVGEPPPRCTQLRPDLPPALDDVLARAMAKSPDDRYSSCREFLADARSTLQRKAPAGATSASPTKPPAGAPETRGAWEPPPPPVGAGVAGPRPESHREPRRAHRTPSSGDGPPPGAGAPEQDRDRFTPPPRDDRPAGPHRRRLLAALGAVIVALGLGGVVYALVHDGGSGDSHGANGLSGTVYDEILLPHIPPHMRDDCKETKQPADVQAGAGQATASCVAMGGGINVSYTKVHSGQAARDSLFAVIKRQLGLDLYKTGSEQLSGDCANTGRGWSFWHRPPGGSEAEHAAGPRRSGQGKSFGRMVCFQRAGHYVIEWTDIQTELYSIAESRVGLARLVGWWQSEAGPLLNPVEHGETMRG